MKKIDKKEINKENKENLNKYYRISQLIITIFTFVVLMAAFIHENESEFQIPIFLTFVVFLISFPSTIISKKLLKYGDKIESDVLRAGYYLLALPIIGVVIVSMMSALLNGIYANIPTPTELGPAIGQGVLEIFIIILFGLLVFIPYFQTIIVLVIMHTKKK